MRIELDFRKELLDTQSLFDGNFNAVFDHLATENYITAQTLFAVAMRAYKVKITDIILWLKRWDLDMDGKLSK